MNIISDIQCKSVKNKFNLGIQCCNKAKINENYCGIHLNSKNIIIFNEKLDEKLKDILNKEDLYNKILNNEYISIYCLRKSIKNSDLNKLISTKQSKPLIIANLKELMEKERFYDVNKYYLIKIQSYIRKWIISRRKKCYNDTDILTFTCKYEIPNNYFYIFNDYKTNKNYAYDIRTLLEIIKSNYPSCPYTFRNFEEGEINKIFKYSERLKSFNINIDIEREKLSYEEETEMKIKDLFYQINMLDNYTNPIWFKNLNIFQLIELYIKMEDLWNYRSNLSLEAKKKIVKNGNIFNIPLSLIKGFSNILEIQNILLDDFLRLITEGIDREEKKLGAILILTGLVEVSYEAAMALPYLIQD